MTDLELFCARQGIDDAQAMNLLTDSGLVSDNCVRLGDVAGADEQAAIQYLETFTP